MKKLAHVFFALLISVVLSTPASAQLKKIAQTGLQFLKIENGARGAAMGGALTVVDNGSGSVFYNPSGIARMQNNTGLTAAQTQWIADISYSSFAVAQHFGNIGTFAVHGIFADYGEITGTQVADNEQGYIETGEVDVGAFAFGVSYARNISDKFSIGGTAKFVGQNLGENLVNTGETRKNDVSGVAYDFGTMFNPGWKSFAFGVSIRNFANEFEYETESFELPLTFNIGASMNVMDLIGMEEQSLLLSVDAVHPRDFTERLHVGAEYMLGGVLALRAGYKANHDIESFSAGAGFNADLGGRKIQIDYAFSSAEFFDSINRFSVGFEF